jgi:hypothetical protein
MESNLHDEWLKLKNRGFKAQGTRTKSNAQGARDKAQGQNPMSKKQGTREKSQYTMSKTQGQERIRSFIFHHS